MKFVIEDTGRSISGKIIYQIGFKRDGVWLKGSLEVDEAELWQALDGLEVYQGKAD